MSMFRVNVIARNPKHEEMATKPLEALVDTGSELTWLPADVLRGAGITPRRKRVFATATKQQIEREVGYAILSAEGYETNDEVVFAESGDMTLLGVRTLEGFGVMVDNIGHRFVATATIVAVTAMSDSQFYDGERSGDSVFSRSFHVGVVGKCACRWNRFTLDSAMNAGTFAFFWNYYSNVCGTIRSTSSAAFPCLLPRGDGSLQPFSRRTYFGVASSSAATFCGKLGRNAS